MNLIQSLGNISFSLYLWHWPVLSFLRYVNIISLPAPIIFLGLGFTFILSVISWKFIENPFRKKLSNKTALSFITLSYLILIIFVGLSQRLSEEKFQKTKMPNLIASAIDTNFRCKLESLKPFGSSRACYFKNNTGNEFRAALIGNSHAQMYAPAFNDALKSNKENWILIPLNGCLPTITVNISSDCLKKAKVNFENVIAEKRISTVVIALTWFNKNLVDANGQSFYDENFNSRDKSLLDLIYKLKERGKNVYLVGPIEIPGFNFASVVSRQEAFGGNDMIITKVPKRSFVSKYQSSLEYFKQGIGDHLLLPDNYLCDTQYCYFSDDSGAFFSDDNHLSSYGASKMNGLFKGVLFENATK